jgi:hypothetical protein
LDNPKPDEIQAGSAGGAPQIPESLVWSFCPKRMASSRFAGTGACSVSNSATKTPTTLDSASRLSHFKQKPRNTRLPRRSQTKAGTTRKGFNAKTPRRKEIIRRAGVNEGENR